MLSPSTARIALGAALVLALSAGLAVAQTVSGGLSHSAVNAVIRRSAGQLLDCQLDGLRRQPELSGEIVLVLQIGPTGAVLDASLSTSTLGDPAVEACMRARASAWTFPAPDPPGKVVVTWPFTFAPCEPPP